MSEYPPSNRMLGFTFRSATPQPDLVGECRLVRGVCIHMAQLMASSTCSPHTTWRSRYWATDDENERAKKKKPPLPKTLAQSPGPVVAY